MQEKDLLQINHLPVTINPQWYQVIFKRDYQLADNINLELALKYLEQRYNLEKIEVQNHVSKIRLTLRLKGNQVASERNPDYVEVYVYKPDSFKFSAVGKVTCTEEELRVNYDLNNFENNTTLIVADNATKFLPTQPLIYKISHSKVNWGIYIISKGYIKTLAEHQFLVAQHFLNLHKKK